MKHIGIIGGGAAGMMAAIASSKTADVTILEKNSKLGKKIYITGKGRCNITNSCDPIEFISKVSSNSNFMYSSIYTLTPENTIDLFNSIGLKTKIERGNRVFPVSDKASDVTKYLERKLRDKGVNILLDSSVYKIQPHDDKFYVHYTDLKNNSNYKLIFDAVIVCTGGLSYPTTGSNGDGFKLAKDLNINVTSLYPTLVPFKTNFISGDPIKLWQGISLKNVRLCLLEKKTNQEYKSINAEFGEMLFTRDGISGPIVLRLSSHLDNNIYEYLKFKDRQCNDKYLLSIDFKPAVDKNKLDDSIVHDMTYTPKSSVLNWIKTKLPKRMAEKFLEEIGIDSTIKLCELRKEDRKKIVNAFKDFRLIFDGTKSFNEAVVTRGGISVSELYSSNMMSKKYKNLFFAGEIVDVDAVTGGFNLQIAFSTGYLAGISASEEL